MEGQMAVVEYLELNNLIKTKILNDICGKAKDKQLTKKQLGVIQNVMIKHKAIAEYFEANHPANEFFQSLYEFFQKNGFLTPSQFKCLNIL